MELSEVLEKTGLTEKQAKVYLALLELGAASVQSIAEKAGLKRPTTYLILDELRAKGLASLVPQNRKALFVAESPEYLLASLTKQEDLFKRFLPELLAIHNLKKEKPQVQFFSGSEGVKKIYQKIFESKEVWFFGTIKEINKIYPEGLKDFLKRVKEKSLKVRDLLTRSEEDMAYAKEVERGPNYEIKFIPEDMSFSTDSAIFGDHVVFFSFHPQIFAVMIKNQKISQSLNTLYELAWQQAQPLPKS